MNLPRNVLRFEVLLYLSLTLDALSVAFQDRTPNAELSERAILIGTVVAGFMITLLVFMVWLAAQRRIYDNPLQIVIRLKTDAQRFDRSCAAISWRARSRRRYSSGRLSLKSGTERWILSASMPQGSHRSRRRRPCVVPLVNRRASPSRRGSFSTSVASSVRHRRLSRPRRDRPAARGQQGGADDRADSVDSRRPPEGGRVAVGRGVGHERWIGATAGRIGARRGPVQRPA